MNDKDYKKLIKEYEKLNASKSDIYPLSYDDCIERYRRLFWDERYIDATNEKKIKLAIILLKDDFHLLKYYLAFVDRDMQKLNDAIYETAHLNQISNILSTSTDHGFYGLRITPELMACNLFDRLHFVLPCENKLSMGRYIGAAITNILMGILYPENYSTDVVKTMANKNLSKKNPEYYKLHIECMIAILEKNAEDFNEKINLYCEAYKKNKEFDMNPFNRGFCIEAHGMYNLARWAYEGAMKDDIVMPIATNFCQELAEWQEAHDDTSGSILYSLPEDLSIINQLKCCRPVQMNLIIRGKELIIDTDRFLQDLISENNL